MSKCIRNELSKLFDNIQNGNIYNHKTKQDISHSNNKKWYLKKVVKIFIWNYIAKHINMNCYVNTFKNPPPPA